MTRKSYDIGTADEYDMPYQEPYKNLAYRFLVRTILDALGKQLCLDSHKRTKNSRATIINEARAFIHAEDDRMPLSFETLCCGLDIDPETIRRRIPKHYEEVKIKLPNPRNEMMKDMFEKGYTLREIGSTFSVTPQAVAQIVGKRQHPKYFYRPPKNHKGYQGPNQLFTKGV